jgi:hypothetical protein
VCVVGEGVADAVAEVLDQVVGVDGDRDVAVDRGHGRHRAVRRQVRHLSRDGGTGRAEQPDVGDPLDQHE